MFSDNEFKHCFEDITNEFGRKYTFGNSYRTKEQINSNQGGVQKELARKKQK